VYGRVPTAPLACSRGLLACRSWLPLDALVPEATRGAIAASWLATVDPSTGIASEIADGAVVWEDGVLTYVGPASGLDRADVERFEGCTIAPGFVDCHTHLPFVGWRADEFEARLAGVSYRELHGEGGIYRSSRLLAEASDDEVLAFCRPLVAEMADHGTTALELKTGYGLSVEAELRQARLARRLAQEAPQTCRVTLLACHAVPHGVDREAWVRVATQELIPIAAAETLVDAVDIYVEDIAFSLDDLERVAEAAAVAGLPLRCHADQLGASGAAEAAVALGARSADHLNHVSRAGIEALANGPTVATLLPTSTLFLRSSPPDVVSLLERGATVAIASDFNPGTSPTLSMPEVVTVACSLYGMTPMQALAASTFNAAKVLGIEGARGTLSVGRAADLVVLDGEGFRHVPYRPGHDPVLHAFVDGSRVGGG
jgi:imidazolonepropionase